MKKFTMRKTAHYHDMGPPAFAATHIATASAHETIDTEIRDGG